jgi:hypothetical protein
VQRFVKIWLEENKYPVVWVAGMQRLDDGFLSLSVSARAVTGLTHARLQGWVWRQGLLLCLGHFGRTSPLL